MISLAWSRTDSELRPVELTTLGQKLVCVWPARLEGAGSSGPPMPSLGNTPLILIDFKLQPTFCSVLAFESLLHWVGMQCKAAILQNNTIIYTATFG